MSSEISYRPSTVLRVAVIASAILFLAFAGVTAATGQAAWVVVALAGCSLLGLLAVGEMLIASVEVRGSEVAVRGLRGERRVPYSAIEEVRLEGGQVHLKVRGAGWAHLPAWLAGNRAMSLRAQIANRTELRSG